jgi:DNA-binding MarR family transcriptional regulator
MSLPPFSLPLPALLSQVLVAFTIEFDNEFELRVPHQTTTLKTGARGAPWLVSLAMWSNVLRFVDEDGVTVQELLIRTGLERPVLRMWLERLGKWWGYIVVEPPSGLEAPTASRAKPSSAEWIVRPSRAARQAWPVWRGLFEAIETRWRERFGAPAITRLRDALSVVAEQLDGEVPASLPVLGYGLFAPAPVSSDPSVAADAAARERAQTPNLATLLAKVLLGFTLDFERESEVSLAICANVLRLLDEGEARIRDLPRLSGVSKEAIAMSASFLEKSGFAVVATSTSEARTKVLRLTAKGVAARDAYRRRLTEVEARWRERFGAEAMCELRESLEALAGPDGTGSPLFDGLQAQTGCWRATLAKPETLPHQPMVLHRGGFPDGA